MVALQCSCLENPHGQRTGGLQSMGSKRVRLDWVTKHSIAQNPGEVMHKPDHLNKYITGGYPDSMA